MLEPKLFVQHIRSIPTIDVRYWSFALSGMVRTPLILSYNELLAFPAEIYLSTIACVSGNGLFGTANWRGVRVDDLLHKLEIDPVVNYATAYSIDGYSATYTLDMLRRALLITHMNDAILPVEHGFPARLIIHGSAGYKMPKWVNRIDLTAEPVLGFWEQRGASLEGGIPAVVSLDSAQMQPDQTVVLRGEANSIFIQIRIDGGAWIALGAAEIVRKSSHLVKWQMSWIPP